MAFSLREAMEFPGDTEHLDKLYHAAGYAALSVLPVLFVTRRRLLPFFLVGVFLLGIVLEYFQGCVPGRVPSAGDAVANAVGVVAGYVLGRWMLACCRGWFPHRWKSISSESE